MIAEREATPTDDFISMLIQGRDRGEPVTDEEIFANVFAIGAAAMTTTSTTAAMTLYAWMRYRDQFEILNDQPELIPDAVEESLRFHPAGLFVFPRFAAVDTEIGGTPIPAGTPVHPCVAAANFDATHYPDPLRFDIRRQPKHIATFGFGGHFCAGAILARKILASSLRAFMSRYPDLALVDPDWDARLSRPAGRDRSRRAADAAPVNDTAGSVTVTVDPDLCTASAVCTFIAPTIFELDDPAGPVRCLLETVEDPAMVALAREAAAACPTGAISIS